MTVHRLDFLDLSTLARYRRNALSLDSASELTLGKPLSATALLSFLNPRYFVYTAVASENSDDLIGQVVLAAEETTAHLTFLAPAESSDGLTGQLLEHLSAQAGARSAFHLLAEVDDRVPAFRSLRQAGFAMYAWQRVWKLPAAKEMVAKSTWEPVRTTDWPAVQSLYGQIVPALLQPVEGLPKQAEGLICHTGSGIQAYVRVSNGLTGIWIQPLIHPDSKCPPERLAGLLSAIGNIRRRPVYVCVRSYQAWLESVLEDMGAQPGPKQAVMVKRLASAIKEPQTVQVVEKVLAKAKPASPIAHSTEILVHGEKEV